MALALRSHPAKCDGAFEGCGRARAEDPSNQTGHYRFGPVGEQAVHNFFLLAYSTAPNWNKVDAPAHRALCWLLSVF